MEKDPYIQLMIAFQEKSESSVLYSNAVNIPRSGKRSIDYLSPKDDNTLYVNQKPEPPLSFTDSQQSSSLDITNALQRYIQWISFRFLNSNDQLFPQYASWETKLRNLHANEPIRKTVMTYLPPLTTKITEYSTIKKYLDYMKKLTTEVNMPYVSLTLDVGAAMNTWKLIWNYPELYSNVLIHLGDFHYLEENFAISGKLVLNSGFEDIIFQSGICSQGSLNGVVFGSHYNRGWIAHNAFSEALERLLLEHFLLEKEMYIPTDFLLASQINKEINMQVSENIRFLSDFLNFKQKVRDGNYGKTAHFWLMYLDLYKHQQLAHLAIQGNNFDLRLASWKYLLPFYFSLDKQNYARYGAFYIKVLENIEIHYPGLKDLIKEKGISIQGQEHVKLRTATDQR